MEELRELSKRQLRVQQFIAACLAAIVVMLFVAGATFVKQMNRLTTALDDATAKLQEIDIESINSTIEGTQQMMESVNEFSAAVDDVTGRVKDFDDWLAGLFGKGLSQ